MQQRRGGHPPPVIRHEGRRTYRDAAAFTSAVSLHAHTWYSREPLAFLGPCAERVPIVNGLMRREIAKYRERCGRTIDLSQAFFRPPLSAAAVFRSEADQIALVCGLRPIVSITDHDSIKAGQTLRTDGVDPQAPVSLEWTVPFGRAIFHVGVHNLPQPRANGMLRELLAHARRPSDAPLADLLDWLGTFPGVLVVLNHPFWDLTDSGGPLHRAYLREFLACHAERLHALELNGYRTQAENLTVVSLARAYGLPVIAGGDRHGCAPNAVLNLTHARSFGEFAAEIREGAGSHILFTRAYAHALPMRKLQTAAEILRDAPDRPEGHRYWTERIFYADGGPARRLCEHWPGGPPRWLNGIVRTVARAPFRQAARWGGFFARGVRGRQHEEPAADPLPAFAHGGHDGTP